MVETGSATGGAGESVLEEAECRQLLADGAVGRIGLTADELPVIFPVNYVVEGTAIVFRTSSGGVLGRAASWGRTVAFQVDSFDPAGRSGWSVLVQGELREAAPAEADVLTAKVQPWAGGDRPLVGKILPSTMTGRRIGG